VYSDNLQLFGVTAFLNEAVMSCGAQTLYTASFSSRDQRPSSNSTKTWSFSGFTNTYSCHST